MKRTHSSKEVKAEAAAAASATDVGADDTRVASSLRFAPSKPIRQPITLAPGVQVIIIAPPSKWPEIKWDGAYVSIDAAPDKPNLTRDTAARGRASTQAQGQSRRAAIADAQRSGNPSEPGGTVEESLPGDDEAADRVARGMELTPESMSFLKAGARSIMRKEEV